MSEDDWYPKTENDLPIEKVAGRELSVPDLTMSYNELQALKSDTKKKEIEGTYREIKGDVRNNAKYKLIAYMKATGMKQKDIAAKVGMQDCRISIICNHPDMKDLVTEIQEEHMGQNIDKRFRANLGNAMGFVEDVIRGDSECDDGKRLGASTWLIEKVTGKAVQQVEHKGNTLASFMDQLDALKNERHPEKQIKDVEAIEAEYKVEGDAQLDSFVGSNIPDGVKVGHKGDD